MNGLDIVMGDHMMYVLRSRNFNDFFLTVFGLMGVDLGGAHLLLDCHTRRCFGSRQMCLVSEYPWVNYVVKIIFMHY